MVHTIDLSAIITSPITESPSDELKFRTETVI